MPQILEEHQEVPVALQEMPVALQKVPVALQLVRMEFQVPEVQELVCFHHHQIDP